MATINERSSLQRLWWKELRQLLPMVALLPMLVVLVLLFHGLTTAGTRQPWIGSLTLVLCFGMPSLFACGAGALLVGYEKELRTLRWLTNLPVAAHRIVRVKVLAALVGLAVLWLLGFLIFALASWLGARVPTDLPAQSVWVANSLYVLLAGFALAWRSRSALMALLLVVPVAVLPYLVAYLIDSTLRGGVGRSSLTLETLLACQAVGAAVGWWLSERWGRQALAAQLPASASAMRWSAATGSRGARGRWAEARVQRPAAALVWQFARQSRAVLWGTSIMLAIAVVLLGTVSTTDGARWLPLAVVLGFLAINWLGVATFQSDGLGGRIRFLSDRGISAPVIWLTRQAIPASLLGLFALLLAVFSVIAAESSGQSWEGVAVAFGLYSLAALVIYLCAQWLGQVVFSPIVAALAAPLFTIAAFIYGGFAIEMLGTPWWLALLLLPLPALATLIMTRRWMDRRLGLSYWASHSGFLAAVCIVPAAPLLIAVLRQPAMPDSVARQLQQEIAASANASTPPIELVAGDPGQRPNEAAPGAAALLQRIGDQLQATRQPVGASSGRVIEQLRSIAILSRLTLDKKAADTTAVAANAPNDADVPAEGRTALQRYRRAVELLVEITRRMRASSRLIDQDMADLLEIWLLTESMRDDARQQFGAPLYEATTRMLADRSVRRAARMRAVALSWQQYQADVQRGQQGELGGYQPLFWGEDAGTLQRQWIEQRRVGLAVADLWELAAGGAEAATPERLRSIAEFWGRPAAYYGIGPEGPYLRADDLDRFLQPWLSLNPRAVANQWSADWERLAAQRAR